MTERKSKLFDASTRVHPGAAPSAIPGYDLLGELGRGGMGVVYKANHQTLRRVVALKTLLPGAVQGQQRQRFYREAQAVAQLNHANIVQIYDIGEHAGQLFVTLELAEGGCLKERMKGKPWAEENAATLLATLARAIHHAHEKGIIHRDIKPGNILYTKDGTPKISDFGLAKQLGERTGGETKPETLTHDGAILGTPAYMAPEQAEGAIDNLGPQADIWAFGVILYQLVTGQMPFTGDTVPLTLARIIGAEPPAPRLVHKNVSPRMERIILKCLRKNPAERYASATALAEDLEELTAPPMVPQRRSRAVWLVLPVVSLLLVVVLAVVLWPRSSAETTTSPTQPVVVNPPKTEKIETEAERWKIVANDLHSLPEEKRLRRRYLTLGAWHNDPVRGQGEMARLVELLAEVEKDLNKLGWIVGLAPINEAKTIYALDWSATMTPAQVETQWRKLLKAYPYALSHEDSPRAEERALYKDVLSLSQSDYPLMRTDWFLRNIIMLPRGDKALWSQKLRTWNEDFKRQPMSWARIAAELDTEDIEGVKKQILGDDKMRRRLGAQAESGNFGRGFWEQIVLTSTYHEAALLRKLGTPLPMH